MLIIIFVIVLTIIHMLIVTLADTVREFLEYESRRLIIRRVFFTGLGRDCNLVCN